MMEAPLSRPFSLEIPLVFGFWGDLLFLGGRRVGVLIFRRLEDVSRRIVTQSAARS